MRRAPKNNEHGQNRWWTFPRRFKFVIHTGRTSNYSYHNLHDGLVLSTLPTDDFHGLGYGHQFRHDFLKIVRLHIAGSGGYFGLISGGEEFEAV